MKDCETKLHELKEKLEKIVNSDFLSFEDIAKKEKIMAVYFVFKKRGGEKPIYIGSTNNLHVRFGTDMKYQSTHTLYKKLLDEGHLPENIRDFLIRKCRYKIAECADKTEAGALEHFAIWAFQPEYNAPIYRKAVNPLLFASLIGEI